MSIPWASYIYQNITCLYYILIPLPVKKRYTVYGYLKFSKADFLLLFLALLHLLEDMFGVEKFRIYLAGSKVSLAHHKNFG